MRIAVVMPSRGLVASRMAESVDLALRDYSHIRIRSHDLALPDCFNLPVHEALKIIPYVTHILFVEEDVVIPEDAMSLMLGVNTDITAINYPIRGVKDPSSGEQLFSSRRFQDRLLWVSLGCTLVRRRVFEAMSQPWFQTDLDYAGIHHGSASPEWEFKLIARDPADYGGQDSTFCLKAEQLGFTLGEVDINIAKADHVPRFNPEAFL